MIGDSFRGEVRHLSQDGLAIVQAEDGKKYFALGVWTGESGRFRATNGPSQPYPYAEVLELDTLSPHRRVSPCPHFARAEDPCQGCPWIFVSYPAQLEQKMYRLRYQLARAHLKEVEFGEIIPSPQEFGYRRRAQFKSNGEILGYAAKKGQAIAAIDRCLILNSKMQAILQDLLAQLPNEAWLPEPPHLWNFIDTDDQMESEAMRLNRRRPFLQANPAQNEAMRAYVRQLLKPWQRETLVLELFAGSGNFTEILWQEGFASIIAYEAQGLAVEQLAMKAPKEVQVKTLNLMAPAELRTMSFQAKTARYLLLNPPRQGARQVLARIQQLPSLDEIIYISCEGESFSHDARTLLKKGFRLNHVQAFDQMPHTPHLELIAHFSRAALAKASSAP